MSPPTPVVLSTHRGPIHTAVYNTGSTYLLTGGQDRQIKLWNPTSGAEIKSYKGHGYEVLGIACTPDNRSFASCGGDRTVFLWDVPTGDTLRKMTGHDSKINAVAFNDDATTLASAGVDMSIRLWDLRARGGREIQILKEARDSVVSLVVKGPLVMGGCVDGYVRCYDIRMGELRVDFFDQPVTSLSPSLDSSLLLCTTLDSQIHLMDLSAGSRLQCFSGHKNTEYRSSAAWGVGERTVVMGDEDGTVRVWGVESGEVLNEKTITSAHERAILSTTTNAKNGDVVTAGADGVCKVWPGLAK